MSFISYYPGNPASRKRNPRLLYLSPPECLDHEMLPGHAERPDRLRAIQRHLTETGLIDSFQQRESAPITDSALRRIHDEAYLNRLVALSPSSGLAAVDPDTSLCPDSLTAAHMATGAVAEAVTEVLAGSTSTAFCAVRPPGHHAESDAAMGFCFYNSIAVAADVALDDASINRVAILDFDVHHGNVPLIPTAA